MASKIYTAQEMRKLADDFGADACGEIGEIIGREAACKQSVTDCNGLGNASAMSDAIVRCVDLINEFGDAEIIKNPLDVIIGIEAILNAALSAPPRNCDRPECATTDAVQEVWRKEDGGKTAYYEWLLATYKKGETDEQK